jgi:hypothetical protein
LPLHSSYLPLGVPNGLVIHHAQGRLLLQPLHATAYFLAPSPSSTEHALNVDPKAKLVKQPLQRFDEPKRKAIAIELHILENAGFIREIKSSTWVSNLVIVPKKNTDIQRVCVHYTSLNKHCTKDPFPLPCIDQIIDSTTGCAGLSFLDAYSGYN